MVYILILAVIALMLGIKLFSLFGQKKYIRKDKFNYTRHGAGCTAKSHTSLKPQMKDVELKLEKITDPAVRLKVLCPSFEMKKFLSQIKNSYKKILNLYAKGDTHSLSDLINIEMMRKFAYEITKREEAELKCNINILKIKEAIVENISFEEDIIAFLRVVFKSEVIHYITNKKSKITDGHKTKINNRKDIWIFSRDLRSVDTTWKLVEINQLF